jgi:CubicO group peptidase (beta-lactamase class C family)
MRDAHKVRPYPRAPGGEGDAAAAGPSIGLNWLTFGSGSGIVWHNGGTGGFRSFMGFDATRRVGVVVLSNSGVSVDDIGFHLLDPAIPLAPVVTGWFPGWGTTLLLIGFGAGVVMLEALARTPRRAVPMQT